MADNYLQFSEQIKNITDDEALWIRDHLDPVAVDADEDTREWKELADLYRFKDTDSVCIEFEWRMGLEAGGSGRSLWIYSEEYGELDHVSRFVQAFLQKWRPDDSFTMTWSATCSKPRIGEFDGGAIFVTTNQSHHICGSDWAAKKSIEWNKNKAKRAS